VTSDPAARARLYRDALYEALAGAGPAVRDAGPLLMLSRLVQRNAGAALDAGAQALTTSLATVAGAGDVDAAVRSAEAAFESPQRFREAIYFARCLDRDAIGTQQLLSSRRYLEGAATPAAFADLRTDREAVLDATTFAELWREPGRLEWMLSATTIWRREYTGVYSSQHAAYNAGVAKVAETMDSLSAEVSAVEQLNSLRRLGPPLAVATLAQFHELERLFACTIEAQPLNEAISTWPACPQCGYKLGEEAPAAEARRVRQAIDRALAGQQARLARRVVSRLLSRPSSEDRLTRFIQVVQASDLAGLANVLDAGLIDFLRELLENDDEPALLSRLVLEFPEVTSANLEAAVARFRGLLQEDLARDGKRVRLDSVERG
jgi:hypothetical protein